MRRPFLAAPSDAMLKVCTVARRQVRVPLHLITTALDRAHVGPSFGPSMTIAQKRPSNDRQPKWGWLDSQTVSQPAMAARHGPPRARMRPCASVGISRKSDGTSMRSDGTVAPRLSLEPRTALPGASVRPQLGRRTSRRKEPRFRERKIPAFTWRATETHARGGVLKENADGKHGTPASNRRLEGI